MASVQELILAAQAQHQPSSLEKFSDFLATGATSFYGGMQKQLDQKMKEIDTYTKLADIAEKLQRMDQAAAETELTRSLMKSQGLIDLNPGEAANARAVASDAMGAASNPTTPTTAGGKIENILQEHGVAVPKGALNNFDVSFTGGRGGIGFGIQRKSDASLQAILDALQLKKDKLAADIADRKAKNAQKQKEIDIKEKNLANKKPKTSNPYGVDDKTFVKAYGLAKDAARRENLLRLQSQGTYVPGQGMETPSEIQVQKYIPQFIKQISGKDVKPNQVGGVDESDPQGLFK